MAGNRHTATIGILDKNPLDTPPDQLKDIKVLSTWVAGEKVVGEY